MWRHYDQTFWCRGCLFVMDGMRCGAVGCCGIVLFGGRQHTFVHHHTPRGAGCCCSMLLLKRGNSCGGVRGHCAHTHTHARTDRQTRTLPSPVFLFQLCVRTTVAQSAQVHSNKPSQSPIHASGSNTHSLAARPLSDNESNRSHPHNFHELPSFTPATALLDQ